MASDWTGRFAGLSGLEPGIAAYLVAQSKVLKVPQGTVVFGPGKAPDNLLLLLDGTVRVQHVSESGREIVLYRVEAGESCIMTTACLLAGEDYSAEGIAETVVEAVAIPRRSFDELLSRSARFRNFVFAAYSKRITDLFLTIDEIAFQRMDIRLAQKLAELSRDGTTVRATHQQMAAELGTAREVVSRQLQEFQRRGWVAQSRGTIELLDKRSVAALGASSG